MKNSHFSTVAIASLLCVACGNSSPTKTATGKSSETEANTIVPTGAASLARGDGIVGEWSLALEAYDANGNHLLDEEERKKGIKNHYYYRFNPDGTCLIHTMKFRGHYEIKELNGKKMLYTYLDEGENSGPENTYEIISESKDELVLLWEVTFWVFKNV